MSESQEVFEVERVLVEALAVLREAKGPMTTGAVAQALALAAHLPQVEAARQLGVSRHALGQLQQRQRRWQPVVGGVFSGLGGRP